MIRTKELRKLAAAATPGPWESRDAVDEGAGFYAVVVGAETRIVASTGRFPDLQAKPDARYLAALDPQTVTALLDVVDGSREALRDADRLTSAVHDAIYAQPFDRQRANDAIWLVHAVLRGALQRRAPG